MGTREPQYNNCLDIKKEKGLTTFGLMSNQVWNDDPRRLTFLLSRYKFVSKLFSGKSKVLEVGCADAFGTRIVLQEVDSLVAVDFDPVFVEDTNSRMDRDWPFECRQHDMLSGPVDGQFDAAYSLDVLEHIPVEQEDIFVGNMARSLKPHGIMIVGSPSLYSQPYASPPSKAGHVNCKEAPNMKALFEKFFHSVFIFSMNDEVVHTGFYPMAQYLIAVCSDRKS